MCLRHILQIEDLLGCMQVHILCTFKSNVLELPVNRECILHWTTNESLRLSVQGRIYYVQRTNQDIGCLFQRPWPSSPRALTFTVALCFLERLQELLYVFLTYQGVQNASVGRPQDVFKTPLSDLGHFFSFTAYHIYLSICACIF